MSATASVKVRLEPCCPQHTLNRLWSRLEYEGWFVVGTRTPPRGNTTIYIYKDERTARLRVGVENKYLQRAY